MHSSTLLIVLLGLMALAYHFGRKRAISTAGGVARISTLHSLPTYYGLYAALWAGIPALLLMGLWTGFQNEILITIVKSELPPTLLDGMSSGQIGLVVNDIKNLASGAIVSGAVTPEMQAAADRYIQLNQIARWAMWLAVLALAVGGMAYAWAKTTPTMRARNRVETIFMVILVVFSSIAILTTLGIILSVLFESLRFFQSVSPLDFFFGTLWSPQTALRADQVGASGAFGAVPLFTGTLMVSAIAMLVAVPIGLMSAIYLSEYAPRNVRAYAKPTLEVLAGVPTVVYGFFAALTVAPVIRELGMCDGLERGLRERARRRPCHGDHDHPLRLIALGGRDQCRSSGDARRLLRPGCDPSRRRFGGSSSPQPCPGSWAASCSPCRARSAKP